MEQGGVKFVQQFFQEREHLKGRFKGNQIPGIGCLVSHPANQAFQIVDWI